MTEVTLHRGLDAEQIKLIKETVAKDATDVELSLFLHHCNKTGLDPLAKQIYFQKRKSRSTGRSEMTILTGIDGYRLTADRTGKYAGSDDPVYDDENNPKKATVTVYKIVAGLRCAFVASARWEQYYPGDAQGFMWRKMPHLMLGKCAEALALRKAFPQELSGVYTKEEMEQDTKQEAIDVEVAEAPDPKKPTAESIYDGSPPHRAMIFDWFQKRGIDPSYHAAIHGALIGKQILTVATVAKEIIHGAQKSQPTSSPGAVAQSPSQGDNVTVEKNEAKQG